MAEKCNPSVNEDSMSPFKSNNKIAQWGLYTISSSPEPPPISTQPHPPTIFRIAHSSTQGHVHDIRSKATAKVSPAGLPVIMYADLICSQLAFLANHIRSKAKAKLSPAGLPDIMYADLICSQPASLAIPCMLLEYQTCNIGLAFKYQQVPSLNITSS